jgi:hypothetical protein
MAVTAHYVVEDEHAPDVFRQKTRLLAFRHVETSHTGKNLAEAMFAVLQEYGILNNV